MSFDDYLVDRRDNDGFFQQNSVTYRIFFYYYMQEVKWLFCHSVIHTIIFLISRSRCTSYLPILSRHQRRWQVMNLYIAAKVLIRSFFSRPHLWTTPTQFHDIVLSLLRMLDLTIYMLTHAYSHAVHTDWILQRDLSVQKDCYTATLLDA